MNKDRVINRIKNYCHQKKRHYTDEGELVMAEQILELIEDEEPDKDLVFDKEETNLFGTTK
jgi:hypothetical protein